MCVCTMYLLFSSISDDGSTRPTALSPGPRGTAGGESLVPLKGGLRRGHFESKYAKQRMWTKARMIVWLFVFFPFLPFGTFTPGSVVLV